MSEVKATHQPRADLVKKKIKELSTLDEMNRQIHSTMNLNELLRILVEKALIGVNFQRGLLYLVEEDYLRCVAWLDRVKREKASIIEKRVGFRLHEKAVEVLVIKTGKPIYIENALTDKRVSPKFLRFSNTTEYCAVPLIGRSGNVFGVLTGDKSYRAKPILNEDIETLSLFAGHISLAIENAKLYEEKVRFNQLLEEKVKERTFELNTTNQELSRKMKELSTLYQISRLLNESLEIDTVVKQILYLIGRLGYESYAVHLLEGKKPVSVFYEGLSREYSKIGSLPLGKQTLTTITRPAEPLIFCNGHFERLSPSLRAYCQTRGINSCIVIPIFPRGKLSALLNIFSSNNEAFSEDQKAFFSAFAEQAGVALDNACLFGQVVEEKHHAEEVSKKLEKENIYLREKMHDDFLTGFVIGKSKSMKEVMDLVGKVSETLTTVTVYGETGTGKEIIGHLIHEMSPRRNKPLIKVNCAAIPEELIESELFGHRRGAFTNAYEHRVGMFELAQGGTIFLDEIGDLSLRTQTKLLRVIEEQEIKPLGCGKTKRIDVRIIAATNKNLRKKVIEGGFRNDLFYRLNGFPIVLPPLRERWEDLPEYINFFIEKYSCLRGDKVAFSEGAFDVLLKYSWPGNIRELGNLIERLVIISKHNVIYKNDLPKEMLEELLVDDQITALSEASDAFKKDMIERALRKAKGKKSYAAKMLGLHRSNFSRLLKSLELSN